MHLGRVGSEHFKRLGAARRMEPFSAAIDVAPALKMHAARVLAVEEIALEIIVGGAGAVAHQMGFALAVQLGFVGVYAAIGTGQNQHDCAFVNAAFATSV